MSPGDNVAWPGDKLSPSPPEDNVLPATATNCCQCGRAITELLFYLLAALYSAAVRILSN